MTVIEFINMFNVLTDEQKQLQISIEYTIDDPRNGDREASLDIFILGEILDYPGCVIVKGK